MQFIEMAEAKAIFFRTGQIQLEMVHIRRNFWDFVNLSIFKCQENSYRTTMISDFLPYVLNPLNLLKIIHKFMSGVEINNNNINSKLQ